MANTALIIFAAITIVLLFTTMVFSAMAASDALKSADDCTKGCHKWSTWAAVTTGLTVATMVVLLVVYVYSRPKTQQNIALAQQHLNRAADQLKGYGQQAQNYARQRYPEYFENPYGGSPASAQF